MRCCCICTLHARRHLHPICSPSAEYIYIYIYIYLYTSIFLVCSRIKPYFALPRLVAALVHCRLVTFFSDFSLRAGEANPTTLLCKCMELIFSPQRLHPPLEQYACLSLVQRSALFYSLGRIFLPTDLLGLLRAAVLPSLAFRWLCTCDSQSCNCQSSPVIPT